MLAEFAGLAAWRGLFHITLLFELIVFLPVRVLASNVEARRPALLIAKHKHLVQWPAAASPKEGPLQEKLRADFAMEKSLWGSHNGKVYFSDRHEHCVKEIDKEGVVIVVAGQGTAGFSGDGGAATAAQLHSPGSIWGDRSGGIYIMDSGNHRIRYVDTQNSISTLTQVAIGITGMWGDDLGHIFLANGPGNKVWRLTISTKQIEHVAGSGDQSSHGDGGLASTASLSYPNSVWGDKDGQLFIAEMGGNRVRKISRAGVISTVAGTGTAGFSGDGGLATLAQFRCICDVWGDGFGRLYIADMDNNRIRQVNANGIVHTLAGNGARGKIGDGGLATSASLFLPKGVWVDRHGQVYISDTLNFRIRMVDEHGMISTFGKSVAASVATVASQRSEQLLRVAIVDGADEKLHRAIVADAMGHSLFSFNVQENSDTTQTSSLFVGGFGRGESGDGGPRGAAKVNYPQGMCVSSDGTRLYFADTGNAAIRVVDLRDDTIAIVGQSIDWHRPTSCAVARHDPHVLYVVDSGRHVLSRVDLNDNTESLVLGISGSPGCGNTELHCPYDVVLGAPQSYGKHALLVTDPCCPDAFVRQIVLDDKDIHSVQVSAFSGGYEGTPDDRAVLSDQKSGKGFWIAGIDDCGLEYIGMDGRRRPVDILDDRGLPADLGLQCIVDVVSTRHGIYFLSIAHSGKVNLVRAEPPSLNVSITPADNESAPFVDFSGAFPAQLGIHGALDLQLRASNGSIVWRQIVEDGMKGLHGWNKVDLPDDLKEDKYLLEAASRRWPSVKSQPFQVDLKATVCSEISGSWHPPWAGGRKADLIAITQTGCSVTATGAHYSWSPATGSIHGTTLHMFHTVARIHSEELTWQNGNSWFRGNGTAEENSHHVLSQVKKIVEGAVKQASSREANQTEQLHQPTRNGNFSWWHLLLAALGGILIVGLLICLLIHCFLKVRHKGYGSMQGSFFYQRRGAAQDEEPEPPREMAPIVVTADSAENLALNEVAPSGPMKLGV